MRRISYCLTISCSCYAVVNLRLSFKRRALSREKASCPERQLKHNITNKKDSQAILKLFLHFFSEIFENFSRRYILIFPRKTHTRYGKLTTLSYWKRKAKSHEKTRGSEFSEPRASYSLIIYSRRRFCSCRCTSWPVCPLPNTFRPTSRVRRRRRIPDRQPVRRTFSRILQTSFRRFRICIVE